MNAVARTEVLGQTDQVKEHGTHPGVAPLPQEVCVRQPGRPDFSDEAGFQTFIHGAGI
jgi:hypothetical protein